MQTFKCLYSFRAHIAREPHATLDAYARELEAKLFRARDRQIKLGYAMALDALAQESEMRRRGYAPHDGDTETMTDDELLAELMA